MNKKNCKANEHPKSLGVPLLIKHLDLLIKKNWYHFLKNYSLIW